MYSCHLFQVVPSTVSFIHLELELKMMLYEGVMADLELSHPVQVTVLDADKEVSSCLVTNSSLA